MNNNFEEFKKYRQRIDKFIDEKKKVKVDGYFYNLVDNIDLRAEKLKMPSFMTEHKNL